MLTETSPLSATEDTGQGDGSPVSLSTQLSSYQVNAGSSNLNLSYTYDSNGNITSVSDGTNTTSYTYDSANQLIRENNQKLNKTWTWAYDGAGNILSRSEYAYTTGTLDTPLFTMGTRGRFSCLQGDGSPVSLFLTKTGLYSNLKKGDISVKASKEKKRKRYISHNAARN